MKIKNYHNLLEVDQSIIFKINLVKELLDVRRCNIDLHYINIQNLPGNRPPSSSCYVQLNLGVTETRSNWPR